MRVLDSVIKLEAPIKYRRNNKYMGMRHELGGNKGRWPRKCAMVVQKVLKTALAAAKSKGITSDMYVVHASANKTMIARRTPPKGILVFGLGRYGPGNTRFSDLEFAKVELGLSSNYDKLSKRIRRETGRSAKLQSKKAKPKSKELPVVEPAAEKAELVKQPAKSSTAVVDVNPSSKVV